MHELKRDDSSAMTPNPRGTEYGADDTAVIPGVAQSEGEKDKVIQTPPVNPDDVQEPANPDDQQTVDKQSDLVKNTKSPNTVPFPSSEEPEVEPDPDQLDDDQSKEYGRGMRPRPPLGT
jgi:hypothetical protein